MSPQIDSIELIVNTNTVTQALDWLEAISSRESWPTELSFSLLISSDEALTNIVSYAFKNTHFLDGDSLTKKPSVPYKISITCLIWQTKIQVKITDNGLPYDPTQAIEPRLAESIESAKLGGVGLRLMRHYLSDITYYYHNDHNHLILSKDIGKTTDG